MKVRENMADPAKFKSVSVSKDTYKILKFLSDGKITDADLTVSKTIESLAKKESKKHGYKNGKE
jgi:hypothetical protein